MERKIKYYIIRVGSDTGKKEYSGDLPLSVIIDKKLLFIPIGDSPELAETHNEYSIKQIKNMKRFKEIIKYFGNTKREEKFELHLDPFLNFDGSSHYSYGDHTKTKPIVKQIYEEFHNKNNKQEKYIIFVSTVTEYPFKLNQEHSWKDLKKKQETMQKFLAIIGFMKIKNVSRLLEKNKNKSKKNPHYRMKMLEGDEVIIDGEHKYSYYFYNNPIVIGKYWHKKRGYILKKNISKLLNEKILGVHTYLPFEDDGKLLKYLNKNAF